MDQNSHEDYNDPPPSYSSVPAPRPPPAYDTPAQAGRANGVNVWDFAVPAWDFEGLPEAASPPPVSPRPASLQIPDNEDTFEYRGIDEYLANPFAAPSEPAKTIVVRADTAGNTCLRYHHKVFPFYWRCMACRPRNSWNHWNVKAMKDDPQGYRPRCPRLNCRAQANSQSVLANAHRESITTLGGENLMLSRLEEPFMWCCKCAALRGEGRNRNAECAHCSNFEASSCPDCVRCNEFLEITRFANGDMVSWGVLDRHNRAQGHEIRGDTGPRSAKEFVRAATGSDNLALEHWLLSAGSLVAGNCFIETNEALSSEAVRPRDHRPVARPAGSVSTPRQIQSSPQQPPNNPEQAHLQLVPARPMPREPSLSHGQSSRYNSPPRPEPERVEERGRRRHRRHRHQRPEHPDPQPPAADPPPPSPSTQKSTPT